MPQKPTVFGAFFWGFVRPVWDFYTLLSVFQGLPEIGAQSGLGPFGPFCSFLEFGSGRAFLEQFGSNGLSLFKLGPNFSLILAKIEVPNFTIFGNFWSLKFCWILTGFRTVFLRLIFSLFLKSPKERKC